MIRILAKGYLQEKGDFISWRASLFAGFFLALFFLNHCRPSEFLLAPLPSKIDRMEGYASIRITGDEGTVRSKFSFLFQLPHQGRIEVSHTFGRTFYQIIINEEKAALILPSKKIYWQGEEDEIINKFLGFRLNLDEMIGLLSGKWRERQMGMDREESMKVGLPQAKEEILNLRSGNFSKKLLLPGSSSSRIL
jgi:hypothetical protein